MISSLHSLRGLFAIGVVLSHIAPYLESPIAIFTAGGSSGVCFFLMLSGFVLSVTYHSAFETGSFDKRRFMRRRLERLMPLYWIMLAAGITATMITGSDVIRLKGIVADVFMLRVFNPTGQFYGYNGPGWCMTLFLLFYAAFPYLYRFITRHLKLSVIAYATAIVAVPLGYALLLGDDDHFTHYAVRLFPPVRFIEFIGGMLLYQAYLRLKDRAERIAPSRVTIIAALSFVPYLVSVYLFYNHFDERWTSSVYWWLPAGVIILVFALFDKSEAPLLRFLRTRPMVYLGTVSFCLYLSHHPVLNLAEYLRGAFTINFDTGYILTVTALCIAAGIAVYELIDKPIGQYLKNRSWQRKTTAAIET